MFRLFKILILVSFIHGFLFGQERSRLIVGFGTEQFKLGDTKKQVLNRYGKSDKYFYKKYKGKVSTYDNHEVDYKFKRYKEILVYGRKKNVFYYKEFEIYIVFDKKNILKALYTYSDRYITEKGLSVGDSIEKGDQLYCEKDSLFCNYNIQYEVESECGVIKKIKIW